MAYDTGHFRDLDRLLPATRTTRPEIARSHLAAIFADHDLRLSGRTVDFSHQQARLCDASIGLLRYGTEVEVVAPPLDFYLVQLTLEGEVAFRAERFEARLSGGTLFVMNPGLRYRKTWSRDARQLMIKIPRKRLTLHAGRPVRFAPRTIALEEADGFAGYFAHVCRDLAGVKGLSAHKNLRREMEDLLLSALLSTQAHEEHDDTGPVWLHRAEAHIRAHLSRSVGISELIAVSETGERALQQGFRRYRDCSPLDFSRNIRLDAARAALLSGGGACVTEIALEFGFHHFGRFAQSYAARFGERPSETVKRARH